MQESRSRLNGFGELDRNITISSSLHQHVILRKELVNNRYIYIKMRQKTGFVLGKDLEILHVSVLCSISCTPYLEQINKPNFISNIQHFDQKINVLPKSPNSAMQYLKRLMSTDNILLYCSLNETRVHPPVWSRESRLSFVSVLLQPYTSTWEIHQQSPMGFVNSSFEE